MNGDLDDWWQGEMVEYTRNVAWRNAQKLWALRHDLPGLARERKHLDGHATAIGRLLLHFLIDQALMRRVLIEGGSDTVSRFLTAKCLDRLHIMVAPIILGSGRVHPLTQRGDGGVHDLVGHDPAQRLLRGDCQLQL